MTRLIGNALRLTVFIGESDTGHHKPLFTEIAHRTHRADWPVPACSVTSKATAHPPASTPLGCCRSARTRRSPSSPSTRANASVCCFRSLMSW